MGNLDNKRIITCAIVGSWPTRENNPNLPLTPAEIADSAYEAWKAGAAIVHIHVRDDNGGPCNDFGKYVETINLIRAHKDCDLCINITSSGDLGCEDEDRLRPLRELKPELTSFDAGTLNWQNRTIFENHPRFLEKLGLFCQEQDIKPEIEIFDAGMVYTAIHYIKNGILKAPCHFQLVLGAAGGVSNDLNNLMYLRNLLPAGSTWAGCGIGAGHMPAMLTTIAMGGHLRVGMEDNVMYHRGVPAESNAQFVARAKRLIEEAGFEAAKPDEARQILGLKKKGYHL